MVYVTIETKLRNKSRHVIGSVLARFERKLTARQLQKIAEETQGAFQAALAELNDPRTRPGAEARLRQLAELDDAGGAGQAALVTLGRQALAALRYEQSEQFFRAAIRDGQVASTTAEAVRDLAAQYLLPAQGLHLEAAGLLDRLVQEFGSAPIPAADGSNTQVTAAQEAARLRRKIDGARVATAALTAGHRRFALAPPEAGGGAPLLAPGALFDAARPVGSTRSVGVLVQTAKDTVQSLDAAQGSMRWTSSLNLLGAVAHSLEAGAATSPQQNDGGLPPRAFCDGQTAIINGPDGLFGVGLVTGRRLWGVAFEDEDAANRAALRDRLVAVDGGRMVTAPRRGGVDLCNRARRR